MTIGEKLDQSRGFGRGFDFLRVFLALSVVASHSYWITEANSMLGWTRASWLPMCVVVPCFFALSGFLIAGSAERLSLGNFLVNRGLRIVPALAVEIMASAFILGPIFTTWRLGDYLTSPRTWHYVTNIVGLINYQLPGVFEHLPAAGFVNQSLWTIPFEITVYLVVAALIATRLVRRRGVVLALALVWAAAGTSIELLGLARGHGLAAVVLQHVFFGRGPTVVVFALAGMAAYQFRHRIPYSWASLATAVAACLAIYAWAPVHPGAPSIAALMCLPVVYIVLFVGVSDIPALPFFRHGDYSYGIYLYGYPLQQAVKSVLPAISNPWQLTAVASVAIVLFAAFSWHCIEKPILRLRKNFSFVARKRLEPEPAAAPSAAPQGAAAPILPAEDARPA
jgi:peptidoglycan/LPS O-acetylase OafA/YrhL